MTPSSERPRDLPDRVIRQSLRHPAHLRAFLEAAVPLLAPGFVWCEKARLLDREFPMDDWRRREADLPFEIPYRLGTEELLALVVVLIKHQSDTDPLMPLRMLYFAVGYWDRQWQEWARLPRPRPPLRLRPVLPLVLYTGTTPWSSNRTLLDLMGEPAALHAFAPVWQPLFWNLADSTPEALLASGAEWLQTLAVIRAQGEDAASFRAVFDESLRRLQVVSERDRVQWYDLLRIVLTWATWRRPVAERQDLQSAAQAAQPSPERQQEVKNMTQTIAESLLEEGRVEGRLEGRVEGDLRTARMLLRALLEKRFALLPEDLLARINNQTDLQRLEAAVLAVGDLEKLEDLHL